MTSALSTLLIMSPCRRLQFNLSDLFPVPRLGLGYLAAALREAGFPRTAVRDIIAERAWIPELLAHLEREGPPDLLGLSVTLLSLREAFEIARGVKGRFPQVQVVVGGPGVGFSAQALLRYGEAVDFFVRGEGEAAMVGLARALSGGGALSDVPGLIWRDGGAPTENPRGPWRELGDGLRVDLSLQPHRRYRLHPPMGIHPPATMMETARGCSYPCEFCCLSMPVRTRPVADVIDEARQLRDQLGYREIHFVDPTFTLSRERALELARGLEPLGLAWSCKTRVDRMDDALAAAMARSGCYLIAFGVESGDDATLSRLGKRAAAQEAVETFALCRRHRIRTTAYLLVASPGDDDARIDDAIRFTRRLKPDYVLYDVLQADPLNPLTQAMIAEGAFTQGDLERYYLTDEPCRLHEITVAGHPVPQAQGWLKRASADFYVRPAYMAGRLRDLRSIQDLKNLGTGGAALMRDALGLGRLWQT